MGFFDSIGDAFNNAKNKASSVIDTGRNKLEGATRFSSRIAHSAASTVRREFNDTTRAVKRTGTSVANVARREFNDTTRAVKRTGTSVANVARREFNDTTRAVKRTGTSVANVARREWNDTTRAVKKTTNSAFNTVRQVNLSNVGHTVLDGAGFIPVVGGVADLANAGWYAAKGDKVNAALSAASAIPFAGDAFAAGKLATKGVIAAKGAEKLAEAGNAVRKTTNVAGVGIKKNNSVGKLTEDLWKGHFNAEVRAGNLEVHIPQTTLKSPTTNKTIQLSGKRRVLDNFVKPSREPGIAVEVKATPRAAQSPNAKAQSSRTQAGIARGVVAGNKKDGYHKVDAQVTKVGLPILGPGGNTGPHLLDPPLDLPHLL